MQKYDHFWRNRLAALNDYLEQNDT